VEQDEFKQLGAKMREARLGKNISLEEIADRTKINRDFLKKFEDGEFDFLPEFYVRHFMKSYLACISKTALRLLEEFEEVRRRVHELEQCEAEIEMPKTAPKIKQVFEMVGIKKVSP